MSLSKVVIVGVGNVGASYAYSMLNQGTADEIVLISLKKEHAQAHADDLNHGNTFLRKRVRVIAGDYSDCSDANIVCITAGRPQKEGETRLDLAQGNAELVKDITLQIKESGFNGVLLVATNPVDVMTYVAQKVSGLPHNQVIGSGTTLDSARFRQNLADYFDTNPKHIHAKIIGEHGDSSVPIWSSAYLGPKPILDIVVENPDKYSFEDLEDAYTNARDAAYSIIKEKGSTYFGIGTSLNNITQAILGDQKSVLSLSAYIDGEFGHKGIYISVPCLVGSHGVDQVLDLNLTDSEQKKFDKSATTLEETIKSIKI